MTSKDRWRCTATLFSGMYHLIGKLSGNELVRVEGDLDGGRKGQCRSVRPSRVKVLCAQVLTGERDEGGIEGSAEGVEQKTQLFAGMLGSTP